MKTVTRKKDGLVAGTIGEAMDAATTQAEVSRNDEERVLAAWAPGDVAPQGDLYIVGLAGMPTSAKPRTNRQMAEGDTQGSRHVVDGGAVFDAEPREVAELIFKATGKRVDPQYIGPVFTGPCALRHPEHGDHVYPGACVNAVVFQRNLDAEEREQRVAD